MRWFVMLIFIIFFYFGNNRQLSEYYTNNQYGNNYPPNTRSNEFNILLSFWDKIAKLYKINYSITYGTYLGWYRDKNYIPYDEDLDVHIGLDSVKNLVGLVNYEWCFYPNELRDNIIKQETPILLINPDHNVKIKSRKRYNCRGKRVNKQEDACSFNGIIGRLIYQKNGRTSHLDIFVYNHETNKTNRDKHISGKRALDYYGPVASYIVSNIGSNLPKTIQCKINGVNTRCFDRGVGQQFLINRYGETFLQPDRIYKNNKWIKK